ncbi:MAG: hypothetical protein F6J98_18310 [Moorea sp. SIO4G2]|nr:hypothetical protein [Moorena sp. SIO4G2]
MAKVVRLKVERDGRSPAFSDRVAFWPRLNAMDEVPLSAIAWPFGQGC